MKKWLLRAENTLLIIPFVLFFFIRMHTGNDFPDIQLHDTYEIAATHAALLFTISLIMLLIIPYAFHQFLRIKQKGNKLISSLHIILSIILLFSFLFTASDFSSSVVPGWHITIYPPGYSPFLFAEGYLSIIWVLFLLVQVSFIMYALVKTIRKDELHAKLR